MVFSGGADVLLMAFVVHVPRIVGGVVAGAAIALLATGKNRWRWSFVPAAITLAFVPLGRRALGLDSQFSELVMRFGPGFYTAAATVGCAYLVSRRVGQTPFRDG
jgi:hypothetical protein